MLQHDDSNVQRPVRIGLAVGHGTGPQLADVFRQIIMTVSEFFNIHVEISQSPRIYHSYNSLMTLPDAGTIATWETRKDADHYEAFLKTEAAHGTVAVFRTSMSAQALYDVRQRLEAVKVEYFRSGAAELLLVRDQAQGFYTGTSQYDADDKSISRTCYFSYKAMTNLIDFAIGRARKTWCSKSIDSIVLVYKHHLFDGIFDKWAAQWAAQHELPIKFVQPDTTNRNLLKFGLEGRTLMITCNEYGDIMQAFLLHMFADETQETSCAENVYLRPNMGYLPEYQTIHGSADDIAGKDLVNPTATARAAAAILEKHAGCEGVQDALSEALHVMHRQRMLTFDQGGTLYTSSFVTILLERLEQALGQQQQPTSQATGGVVEQQLRHAQGSRLVNLPPSMLRPTSLSRGKPVLVVMDWQNDFLRAVGRGVKFSGNESKLANIGRQIAEVVENCRKSNVEVIFVRFLGDEKYQLPNWKARDLKLGRNTECLEGTPGAEIAEPLVVREGEHVFDKHAYYDAFMTKRFEQYIQKLDPVQLVFVGIYADVCIDATLRTAFQRGYVASILSDCTTTLHIAEEQYNQFASLVYGADVVAAEQFCQQDSEPGAGIESISCK